MGEFLSDDAAIDALRTHAGKPARREARRGVVNGAAAWFDGARRARLHGGMNAAARRTPTITGLAVDIGALVAVGVFFGLVGPFDTDRAGLTYRLIYWVAVMSVGALVVLGAERAALAALPGLRRRRGSAILATAALASPLQTLVVCVANRAETTPALYAALLPAVAIVTVAATALLHLARPGRLDVRDTAELSEDATGSSLTRALPAKLRGAGLIALQAEDHYVRVHTEAGEALIRMRLADAIKAADAPGFRLHRSWWAPADRIEQVKFKRGSGEARLSNGLTAPVSRTCYPALREAGWF